MRTIAITLGDNDFSNTFFNLLDSILSAIQEHGKLSEEAIKIFIMEGIKYHYLAFQRGDSYDDPGYGDLESTIKYLHKHIKIHFDDDAEFLIHNKDYDSGAWYLDIQLEIISSF